MGRGRLLEGFVYVFLPVGKRPCQHAAEDKVKAVREGPGFRQVIDLKFDVGWHAAVEAS